MLSLGLLVFVGIGYQNCPVNFENSQDNFKNSQDNLEASCL